MNREELVAMLTENGIDAELYGTGVAKTIDHLLREINCGETTLDVANSKLVRRVRVMQIEVYSETDDGHSIRIWKLRETKQVFKDGRVRVRKLGFSVAEKMLPNEEPKDAVLRALKEELGVTEIISLRPITTEIPEVKESSSYPGLYTHFERYNTSVLIKHNNDGFIEEQPDKTTYFEWVLDREYSS